MEDSVRPVRIAVTAGWAGFHSPRPTISTRRTFESRSRSVLDDVALQPEPFAELAGGEVAHDVVVHDEEERLC
jgi:hypothetical protein